VSVGGAGSIDELLSLETQEGITLMIILGVSCPPKNTERPEKVLSATDQVRTPLFLLFYSTT
jgi:hypothetical protein